MKQNERNPELLERKPGRPKALPEALIPKVLSFYEGGLGYRAIARELRNEGISVNWSTVRRVIKAQGRSKP
jgi:hypothetical protein